MNTSLLNIFSIAAIVCGLLAMFLPPRGPQTADDALLAPSESRTATYLLAAAVILLAISHLL